VKLSLLASTTLVVSVSVRKTTGTAHKEAATAREGWVAGSTRAPSSSGVGRNVTWEGRREGRREGKG